MAEPNRIIPRGDEATLMPTRADFEKLSAMAAEAIALCEAAQEEFVRINDDLQRTIQQSRKPPVHTLLGEERARRRLFDARIRLSDAVKKAAHEKPRAAYWPSPE